jgi:CheY-like chemotaxis protein
MVDLAANGARVLIADDERDTRRLVRIALERSGYAVCEAANGAEVLALTAREMFDIILLDVMMPQMSGYQVCKRLKENPATRNIPIVFLSAKAQLSDVDQGLDCGAAAYIPKPFSTRDLAQQVAGVLAAGASSQST